jgi:hypothetical protein
MVVLCKVVPSNVKDGNEGKLSVVKGVCKSWKRRLSMVEGACTYGDRIMGIKVI